VTGADADALEVRPPRPDELDEFFAHHDRVYGRAADPRLADVWREAFDYGRSLVARRDGRLVATAGAMAGRLRTPGGSVSAAILSYLTVDPSQRRRSLSVDILRRQYEESIERGEPVAAFVTSHSYPYARIGAGVVAWSSSIELHNAQALLLPTPTLSSEISIRTESSCSSLSEELGELYTQATASRAGTLELEPQWWRAYRAELALAGGPQFVLIATRQGRSSGYATYSVEEAWPDGVPSNVVRVHELIAEDQPTRRALWELLLTLDLASTTLVDNVPVDDTLRWFLREPRELRVRGMRDLLWARLLDLPEALAGRRYRGNGSVVIEVSDRFLPRNDGCWRIEASDGEGRATKTDAAPQASISIGDLATLLTGAGSYYALRDTGRVKVHDSGADELAALFAVDQAPWSAIIV
jgi:predicted acetyltransferase